MDEVDGPTDKRTLKASLSLFDELPNVQLKPKPQIWLTPQLVLDYFLRLSTDGHHFIKTRLINTLFTNLQLQHKTGVMCLFNL